MNKIERALLNRAKELLFEYATDELERIRKELQQRKTSTLLNVFNTGVLLDLNKLQNHGIGTLLKALENKKKTTKKSV